MSNADNPSVLSVSNNAIDYAIYQMISRADAGFFGSQKCGFNGSLDPEKDTVERNFFFIVYNTKMNVRYPIEATCEETFEDSLDANQKNYNVFFLFRTIIIRNNDGLD